MTRSRPFAISVGVYVLVCCAVDTHNNVGADSRNREELKLIESSHVDSSTVVQCCIRPVDIPPNTSHSKQHCRTAHT